MQVSLVLGSGGARGYAHVGVIEELLRRGHEIVSISGASMGALIGGLYCADAMDEFVAFARSLGRAEVMKYIDPALNEPGLIKAKRVTTLLSKMVGDVQIEDLPIPFSAVATDIVNRREVWFRKGSLVAAIRASIAIPTVFTPVMINNRLLADGGVLNPLPVEPGVHPDTELIVGVSLIGRDPKLLITPREENPLTKHEPHWGDKIAEDLKESSWGRKLVDLIPGSKEPKEFQAIPDEIGITEMLTMALDAMQGAIQQTRIAANPPDVLIEIPTNSCGVLDFHCADQMIEMGRELADNCFDSIGL